MRECPEAVRDEAPLLVLVPDQIVVVHRDDLVPVSRILILSLSLSLSHTHTLTHSLTHSHSLKVTVPHMIVTEVSRVRQRAAETAGLVGLGAGAECLAVAGGLGLGAIEADGGREMIMSRVGALAE